MEVRIVGSEDELGENVQSLKVFGNTVFRDKWTEVQVTKTQAEKLKGNRFFDVRGQADAPTPEEQEEADTIEQVKKRLDELQVSYSPKATLKTLEASLERAEKRAAVEAANADTGGE